MRSPVDISREPREGEIECPNCRGDGIVEYQPAPHGPYGEEPDVMVHYCERCEGYGVVAQEEVF